VGAVFYGLKRPNPKRGVFGFHELFHACTVIAFLCHWTAILLLVLMLVVMYTLAAPYYTAVREAAGIRPVHAPETAPVPDASPQRLDALLTSTRPMQIMGIGSIGLLLIIWLMVVKPF
jgi:hypothetical protein